MMTRIDVKIKGVTPLLLNNPRAISPFCPLNKELKPYIKKQAGKKTDEDHRAIAWIKYQLASYCDPVIGPYLTSDMVEASIRQGATVNREGKKIQASVLCADTKYAILYDGPRNVEKLYEDERFVHESFGAIKGAKVVVLRPIFPVWELEFSLLYDQSQVDERTIRQALDTAGALKGIGTWRPKFGRYEVTKWHVRENHDKA